MFICRRIAYQEATQTFGVITSRIDFHDSYGLTPTRRSASTQAQNVTTRWVCFKFCIYNFTVRLLRESSIIRFATN